MSAVFSPCRTWRYVLTRHVENKPRASRAVLFVMLNPSTADETKDDPTIRRCIGFAKAWGFDQLVVCNLFGLRATDPRALYLASDPVGPENVRHIMEQARLAKKIVLAWGNHGMFMDQADVVRDALWYADDPWIPDRVHVLGENKNGEPKHPLYLRADTKPYPLWA